MIKVQCPQCGKQFAAPEKMQGRAAKCKSCGAAIAVPKPPLQPPLVVDDPNRAPTNESETPLADGSDPLPLATPAMACGFAGLAIPGVNLVAVILGIVSVSKFEDQQHAPDDRRKAVTGIVLGVIGLLIQFIALLAGLVLMFLSQQSVPQKPPQRVVAAPAPPQLIPMDEAPAQAPSPPIIPPLPKPPPKRSGNVYYLDLNTGRLFADKASLIAPIASPSDSPSGKVTSGVKAYVFSCGDCNDEKQRFVAWVERHIPAAKELREKGDGANVGVDGLIDSLSAPIEISTDNKHWRKIHPIHYLQWRLEKARRLCPNSIANACQPP